MKTNSSDYSLNNTIKIFLISDTNFFDENKTHKKDKFISAILYGFKYYKKNICQNTIEKLINIYDTNINDCNDNLSITFLNNFRKIFIEEFPSFDIFFSEGEKINDENSYAIEKKVLVKSDKRNFYEKMHKNWNDHSSYNCNQNIIDVMILPNEEFVFKNCKRQCVNYYNSYEQYINGIAYHPVRITRVSGQNQLQQCIAKGLCNNNPKYEYSTMVQILDLLYILSVKTYNESDQNQYKYSIECYFMMNVCELFTECKITFQSECPIIGTEYVIKNVGVIFTNFGDGTAVIRIYQLKNGDFVME